MAYSPSHGKVVELVASTNLTYGLTTEDGKVTWDKYGKRMFNSPNDKYNLMSLGQAKYCFANTLKSIEDAEKQIEEKDETPDETPVILLFARAIYWNTITNNVHFVSINETGNTFRIQKKSVDEGYYDKSTGMQCIIDTLQYFVSQNNIDLVYRNYVNSLLRK